MSDFRYGPHSGPYEPRFARRMPRSESLATGPPSFRRCLVPAILEEIGHRITFLAQLLSMPGVSFHHCRWLCVFAACCAAVLAPAFGNRAIAADPLMVQSATTGFGGVYKAGYWTQILVKLQAGPEGAAGRLNLLTEDGDGVPVIFPADHDSPLELQPGEVTTVRLYAKAGPQRSVWHLQLRTGEFDHVLWSQRLDVPPPQRATQELLVALGPAPGVAEAAALNKRPEEVSFLAAAVEQPSELPDRVWGYEGVERIVLMAGEQSWFAELKAEQLLALEQWVRLGGKLLLSVGARAPELMDSAHPLAKLVPGKFAGLDPLRETLHLKNFANVDFPQSAIADKRPPVIRLTERTGRTELEQGGDNHPPLVLLQAYGFGQVTFVAFDLDHPTIVAWPGQPRMLARLLTLGGPKNDNLAAAKDRSITHLGYDDLIGQLRAVLDQFTGVTVVSFTAVAMVAILLLLLIGPGDYFLLRHFNLPRWLTWLTFPAICLLFAAGAWYLGLLAHGQATRVNQVEIVDIDASQGIVRGTLWTHLYSPAGRNWQMSLQLSGKFPVQQPLIAAADWQGLPGAGLGGLASPQFSLDAANPYLISPPGKAPVIDSLPLRTASSKALSGRWSCRTAVAKDLPPLRMKEYGHLEGDILNPLPFKLFDCHLTTSEWLYRIDELQPKQKLPVGSLPALNLEARLTRRQVIDSKDLSTPWQSDDTDLPRIVQMMMLHNAVKGPTYTGMSHRYQPQIDLSEHLRLGRAILTGRAQVSAAGLSLEGLPAESLEQQNWIWYRVIIPVTPRETTGTPATAAAVQP